MQELFDNSGIGGMPPPSKELIKNHEFIKLIKKIEEMEDKIEDHMFNFRLFKEHKYENPKCKCKCDNDRYCKYDCDCSYSCGKNIDHYLYITEEELELVGIRLANQGHNESNVSIR